MGVGRETAKINSDREKVLNVQIGKNLAILRKMRGLQQRPIEKQLGHALHALSKFERGDASFTPDIIEMFANYYGVPKWMLYDQIPDDPWYEIFDVALYKVFQELPSEDKKIHIASISNNWELRNPGKSLDDSFEGRILQYIKAFKELSIK